MTSKILTFIGASAVALLISACSPMNSNFSCNATAGDSCMTIEQVDAMTRFADGDGRHSDARKYQRGGSNDAISRRPNNHEARVWVRPHPMK